MQDLRLALRALRATPIVSLVAVLSLALGIGANTAIFSLVHNLLLRTLPVEDPQQLVTVSSDFALRHGYKNGAGWNYGMWKRFQQRAVQSVESSPAFANAFAWTWAEFDLAQRGEMQPARGMLVSGDFFTTLGVPALLGRTFTPADDVRGGGTDGPVAVITYGLWQRRFGGAANVIGTTMTLKRVPFTIVGVTPPEFTGIEVGESLDVVIPIGADAVLNPGRTFLDSSNALMLTVMVRLKPDQTIAAATAALNAMRPEIMGKADGPRPPWLEEAYVLAPAGTGSTDKSQLRQRYEQPLLAIGVVVALVLLIACANIANLQLARATARQHELSVRLALGASRWRLARLLFIESLVLSGIGAIVGVAFAMWASRALVLQLAASNVLSSVTMPVFLELPLEWRVIAFAAAVGILTTMIFGTAPAFRASRAAPIDAMKAQGRTTSGEGRISLSSTLVIAQVALSLILVVAAGLFVGTFERLAGIPLGFDRDRVLVVNVDSSRARADAASRAVLHARLVETVAALPGVAHASASTGTPGGTGMGNLLTDARGRVVDAERRIGFNLVTPDWFATYGIPLRAGRDVTDRDTLEAPAIALVNETFARRFLSGSRAGDRAVGTTLDGKLIDGPTGRTLVNDWLKGRTIVGIVGDAVNSPSRRDALSPMVYLPLAQAKGDMANPNSTGIRISVRAADGSPATLARSIASAMSAVEPNLAFGFRPLADTVDASLAQERVVAMLSGFFGVLALLLAGLGLYGITAYAVSRRRAEIGIRMALGADTRRVLSLVLTQVVILVTVGVIVGMTASLWLSRFVSTLLYGLEPHDPLTMTIAAAILVMVGAIAGGVPARRASRIDPAVVLRQG